MKLVAVALVLLLAVPAVAAPPFARSPIVSTVPAIVDAEAAWTRAASAPHESARAAWLATILAFDRARIGDPAKPELAFAVVQAYRNALAVDHKVDPPASDAFVRAVPVALALAAPGDEPTLRFLRARLLFEGDHLDEAAVEFGEVVARFPASDVAESAANLLLETLNRQHKFDELLAWVDRMRADPKLLAHRPELGDTLDRLHIAGMQKRAEKFAEAGDAAGFLQCAQTFRAILIAHPKASNADQLLYNAGVCFHSANQPRQATLAWQELIAKFPKSPLADKARAQLGAKG